jgi:stage II sporulation protein R
MCLPAAEESQELEDVLDAQQLQIVEGQNRYIIKFKTLEYYEQIKAWLAGF